MKKISLIVLLVVAGLFAHAQQPPFWNDIQRFRQQDSVQAPAKGQILFIGSSSFTIWKDVQDYFPGHSILNRAFGGSTLPDLIRYVDDIVFPYDPKQVVVYCGENDLASSDTVSPAMVLQRFKTLFNLIRAKYPRVPVVFVSLKPSPSRQHLFPKMVETNLAISKFLKKKKKTAFVDVYQPMLRDGKAMEELFLEDRLHMNASGYKIWQKLLAPYLAK